MLLAGGEASLGAILSMVPQIWYVSGLLNFSLVVCSLLLPGLCAALVAEVRTCAQRQRRVREGDHGQMAKRRSR